MSSLFTQFKQWVDLIFSKDAGAATNRGGNTGGPLAPTGRLQTEGDTLGAFFERVSGGEVSYSLAEAAQANSRGQVYRTTRFRISEITLENNLDLTTFTAFSTAFTDFRKNGNKKMTVRRVLRDGEGKSIRYEYSNCSVLQPPSIDDGDVGRDQEFVMMRIRLQPEIVKVFADNKLVQEFNPYVQLDGDDYTDGKY